MKLLIEPYVGIGPLRFGMTIEEVRSILKEPSEIHPVYHSVEYYPNLGIKVDYWTPGVCMGIEVSRRKSIYPEFQGQRLLNKPINHMLEWFKERDPEVKLTDTGLSSPKFGITLYCGSTKSLKAPVESIFVSERNLYNSSIKESMKRRMDLRSYSPPIKNSTIREIDETGN